MILQKFHDLRPKGHYVDARRLRSGLPVPLRKKVGVLVVMLCTVSSFRECVQVSRKTIVRRLGEKGYKAQKKLDKHDPGPTLARRRVEFAHPHAARSKDEWKTFLQVR